MSRFQPSAVRVRKRRKAFISPGLPNAPPDNPAELVKRTAGFTCIVRPPILVPKHKLAALPKGEEKSSKTFSTHRNSLAAMAGTAWTDEENDAIVAEYFAMLSDDLAGREYTKAEYNRRVQASTGRGRGSVEYKFQNISAALKGFGETWIEGYKPAFNFQASLTDAVARWFDRNPDWSSLPRTTRSFADAESLFFAPPPTQRNTPPPDELEQMQATAAKFDVAGRDERNRALGKAGEERILAHESSALRLANRPDLADQVRWTSQEDGDGAGYDIASFTPDARPRLIEVKTTNGWERTPFHISRNELAVAEANRETWSIVRLWNFAREPRAFEIRPPLDAHVSLTPTSFQASFH